MPSGGSLLPPFSIGYCKGWKRAVVALITLQGIRELNLETEISHRIKVSCRLTYRIYSAGTRFIAFLFLLVLLTFTSISMIAYSLLVPDLQQLFSRACFRLPLARCTCPSADSRMCVGKSTPTEAWCDGF